MSTDIFVESNELREAASRTGQIIGAMENINQAISQIGNAKSSFWQGQAAERNLANMGELARMLAEYLSLATGTRQALEEAVAHFSQAEQGQVRQVQNLSTQGIF